MIDKQDENIEGLSSDANEIMAENKYYYKKLFLYDKYIKLTKTAINSLLSNNKIESAIECFDKYIKDIQKDYDNLNESFEQKDLPEYNNLIENCFSEIKMGKPLLEKERNTKFYLDYSKSEKEDIIKDLKKSIKKSKEFQLFREPSRFTFIGLKEGTKEIEKTTNELQQNMLYELKKCNKYKERILKYNEQMKEITKNINILKKWNQNQNQNSESNISIEGNNIEIIKLSENKKRINDKNNKLMKSQANGIFNDFTSKNLRKKFKEDNKSVIDSDDRNKKNKDRLNIENDIINNFTKVEDLLNLFDVDTDKDDIIFDELNSDEEIVFENKIKQPKKLIEFTNDQIKIDIPIINLDQIEYNKMKVVKEDDIYSIQRRKYRSQNIDNNIKELKKNIEKIEQQLTLIKEKEKTMKKYIEKVKKYYSELRKFSRRNTSVHNKNVKFIRKSLLYTGGEKIKEETNDEENEEDSENESGFGSDYGNEEKEKDDIVDIKDIKGSVFVETYNKKNWGGNLGKSVNDNIFKNKLRNKLKKIRAKSK